MQHLEVTVGNWRGRQRWVWATGDNLAKVCSRLGLHVFVYNSHQSLVRGGHVWLRLRIGAQKVTTHGDHLTLLTGLNQDTLDRHAREVVPGVRPLGSATFVSGRLREGWCKNGHGIPTPGRERARPDHRQCLTIWAGK